MNEAAFLHQCPPPWKAFPQLTPDGLASHLKQGVTDAWFDQQWRPFWSGLSVEQKNEYLESWRATAEWRDALAFHFDDQSPVDLKADAAESEEYLASRRTPVHRRFGLGRIFGNR
jgi:hypothetical protein